MRPRVLWKFANVLMISRLRSVRQSVLTRAITGRPLLILIVGSAVFTAALLAGLGVTFLIVLTPDSLIDLGEVAVNIATLVPFFLVSFYFLTGLLWEVNASTEAESTDAINWLPISPGEYVTASAISTAYTYSPFLFGALGFALPILIYGSGPLAYLALVFSGIVASIMGSVAVEILRSGLNRASSSFNRLGGRTTVIMRLVAVSLVILITQILFSGYLFFRVFSLAGATGNLIPVFWPSLSITALIAGDVLGFVLYTGLELGFLGLLVFFALFLRGRYWLSTPSSPRLSGFGSISMPGRFGVFKMRPVSAALLRYEFRSATRRRETTRLIVLPIVIPLMMIFPLFFATGSPFPSSRPASPPPAALGLAFYTPLLLLGIGLGTTILGMSSIGREGGRIWNVCALPITAKELARAKLQFTVSIALIGLFVGAIVVSFLSGLSPGLIPYFVAGFGVIFAESGLGLAIGSRYADFAEGPRPRFVSVSGAIIGSVLGLIIMGIVLLPLFVSFILEFVFGNGTLTFVAPLVSLLIGLAIGWLGYRLSISPLAQVLSELPA